jgi:hypothetical protein
MQLLVPFKKVEESSSETLMIKLEFKESYQGINKKGISANQIYSVGVKMIKLEYYGNMIN